MYGAATRKKLRGTVLWLARGRGSASARGMGEATARTQVHAACVGSRRARNCVVPCCGWRGGGAVQVHAWCLRGMLGRDRALARAPAATHPIQIKSPISLKKPAAATILVDHLRRRGGLEYNGIGAEYLFGRHASPPASTCRAHAGIERARHGAMRGVGVCRLRPRGNRCTAAADTVAASV